MSKWYYSVDGRAQGPAESDVILEALKAGKLTLVDLVFREGDDGWRTLGEIPEFKDAFAKVSLPTAPHAEPSESAAAPFTIPQVTGDDRFKFQANPELTWVLLVRVPKTGEDQFHQSGPYSAEQISSMLAKGECKYSDYVWRPGYRRWARIGNLPEFDRRKKSRDGDRVPEVVPLPTAEIESPEARQAFLENLMRTSSDPIPSKHAARQSESPPPETDGHDFAEVTAPGFDIAAAEQAQARAAKAESSGPPPIEPRDISENTPTPLRVPDPPAVTSAPESSVVVYGGRVRAGGAANEAIGDLLGKTAVASHDDGKTVVFSRPPGADPQKPPTIADRPVAGAAFDPDKTMVHMPGSADVSPPVASPGAADAEGELFVEESPSFLLRMRQPLIAIGVVAILGVVAMQVLEMRSKPEEENGRAESASSGEESNEPAREVVDQKSGETPRKESAPVAPAPKVTQAEKSTEEAAPSSTTPPAAPPVVEAASPPKPQERPIDEVQAALKNVHTIAPRTGRASQLELLPVQTDGAKTVFAVNTDAAIGSYIYMTLLARTGEVLKYPSFYLKASVSRANDKIPMFEFPSQRFPPGQYRVEVATGDLRKAKNVFIGSRNGEFDVNLERHLKDISFQQQNEKKALFHSARLMEGLAEALGKNYFSSRKDARKWRSFYVSWRKDVGQARKILVDRINIERRNELAYPDEIFALKIAAQKLMDQAGALNDSILSNTQARDVAGVGNLAIVKEFSRLKVMAASISARKNEP
ncbi:MAG: GYF domain-containing protein [Bdellovibrionaceae bacterium]|nr:GYF domain-containing protein [Pseudobdellovibrionaceae bacterium]